MASFDSFDYNIEERLPEWWKGFGALEPINKRTQQLIAEILQGLLSTMGVIQPLNCWLTIPEEYNWYHHYKATDGMLKDENGNNLETERAVTTLFANNKIYAQLPNTKRKCHAKIQLKLLGTEINDNEKLVSNEKIEELIIQNADQVIKLENIDTTSTIEILTESNNILIDGVSYPNLIEGKLNKIAPVKKNNNYETSYIDTNGEKQIKHIDLEDENKKTEIMIHSSKTVNFDLQIYLLKPTYTTEQNIKIASVSAFPIEWVRLYGYFCHPFNDNSGYKFLWEKKYTKESRTVFDRITKQYDCERFCIKVKFYGIDVPLVKGFPQEIGSSKPAYQPNPNLDKWGKIYNLPRRAYKTDITEDEEPFTFPKYYKYPIEQDYWYEERMINEYRFNDDSVNALFIKDNEFNNIGMLECIYPFMDDIWVYTETIDPNSDTLEENKNATLCNVEETNKKLGVEWKNPNELKNKPIITKLNPKSEDVLKNNDFSYQTKFLKLSFNLKDIDKEIPKHIKIKGIELKFRTNTDIQSKTIKLHNDSSIIIPYKNPIEKTNYILEEIKVVNTEETWLKNKGYYTIGGENNIFNEKEITREQLFNGNNGKLDFEIGFINENDFLEAQLYIADTELTIYYEVIQPEYSFDVEFETKEINLQDPEKQSIKMNINISNTGEIEVKNKEIFIIVPSELVIENNINSYLFNLDKDEICDPIEVVIKPKIYEDGARTGKYDILVICEDKVISNEILIRGKES